MGAALAGSASTPPSQAGQKWANKFKDRQKEIGDVKQFVALFSWQICLNHRFQSSASLFSSGLVFFFDLLMGETKKTPHFYDFGILGRVQIPQGQYDVTLEIHLNQIEKNAGIFKLKHLIFVNLTNVEIESKMLTYFETGRCRKSRRPV